METVIILNTFASIMWITGALIVSWFVDMLIDFFLASINTVNPYKR